MSKVKEKKIIEVTEKKPSPHLYLTLEESHVVANLFFRYGKEGLIAYEGLPSSPYATVAIGDAVYQIVRDVEEEKSIVRNLLSSNFQRSYSLSMSFYRGFSGDSFDFAINFATTFIKEKKVEGWTFSFAKGFPVENVYESDEWYVNTQESGNDWFDLELGSIVDGKKVNLIPALRKILASMSQKGLLLMIFQKKI